jgi:hypothetical protein
MFCFSRLVTPLHLLFPCIYLFSHCFATHFHCIVVWGGEMRCDCAGTVVREVGGGWSSEDVPGKRLAKLNKNPKSRGWRCSRAGGKRESYQRTPQRKSTRWFVWWIEEEFHVHLEFEIWGGKYFGRRLPKYFCFGAELKFWTSLYFQEWKHVLWCQHQVVACMRWSQIVLIIEHLFDSSIIVYMNACNSLFHFHLSHSHILRICILPPIKHLFDSYY